jgi:LacI family transcriptional regulator
MAAQLLKLKCPVVDVLGSFRFQRVPAFDTDAMAVAKMAADFFLKAGFKHFAFSGYQGIPFSDRRAAAFAKYLAENGRQVREMPAVPGVGEPVDIQTIEQHGMMSDQVTAHWLNAQPHPLAVLACNDVRAQQILNACRKHNIRVPEEMAVLGVDNDDVLCNLCDPPLTSIEPNTDLLGYEAAAALAQAMAGKRVSAQFTQIAPLRLLERASTDVIAMDDLVMVQAVRFIRHEVGSGIAVKDVLAHVRRSRTDLEQRFRRWLGTGIHSHIEHRRLERVCQLLLETKYNLDEVARRAGFTTAAHLCRLFKKNFQQTPTQFRRGARKVV